ncbi:hypothetical protein LEP1GSC193_3226 [Leptospira alstonii serovar Pingchang str. 80-412]|uniref:Uncharacterized protein n=2 Tax=Leptospira alstonii TaxID=28452 RepID=M6D4I1_9LEPT|nr:hypothetical protein LEP1GSC194_3005 [Leptospira alstonii serovar Sichuan str. 79601]EQA79323.1 hypothetical protein LEP1GSC193_3226 [Leptospira alstonii serovar Pingchang str. 80-412]
MSRKVMPNNIKKNLILKNKKPIVETVISFRYSIRNLFYN